MGFRVDGCGTYDGSKKIKLVGEFMCPSCGRTAPFYIYETSKKITVLYVPVAKIKKEYGVYCEKCKKGYILTGQQMTDACNGDLRYVRSLLGDILTTGNISTNNTGSTNSTVKYNICPNCKTLVGEGMSFCAKCGTRLKPNACPNCKTPVGEGMSFCSRCGTRVG